jgi:hypothetical protein
MKKLTPELLRNRRLTRTMSRSKFIRSVPVITAFLLASRATPLFSQTAPLGGGGGGGAGAGGKGGAGGAGGGGGG